MRDEVPNCRLGTLASRLGLPHRPTHRALDDALATGDLLHVLLERAAGLGVIGLDDLLTLPKIAGHPQVAKLSLTDGLPRTPRRVPVPRPGRPGALRRQGHEPAHPGAVVLLGRRAPEGRPAPPRGPPHRPPHLQRRPRGGGARGAAHPPVPPPVQPPGQGLAEVRLPQADRRAVPPAVGRADGAAPTARSTSARCRRPAPRCGSPRRSRPRCPIRRCTGRPGSRVGPVRARRRSAWRSARAPARSSEAEYQVVVERLRHALTVDPSCPLRRLGQRIDALATAQRFEEAADVRDRAAALAQALRRQRRMDGLRRAGRLLDRPAGRRRRRAGRRAPAALLGRPTARCRWPVSPAPTTTRPGAGRAGRARPARLPASARPCRRRRGTSPTSSCASPRGSSGRRRGCGWPAATGASPSPTRRCPPSSREQPASGGAGSLGRRWMCWLILAVLLGFAVLSGLAVLVAVLLAMRSLHRRNRVSPDQRERRADRVAVRPVEAGPAAPPAAVGGGRRPHDRRPRPPRAASCRGPPSWPTSSKPRRSPSTATCRSSPASAPRERTLALRRLAEQVNEVEQLVSRLSLLDARRARPAPASATTAAPWRSSPASSTPSKRPAPSCAPSRPDAGLEYRHLSPSPGPTARLQALGAGGDGLGDQPVEGGGGPAVVDRRRAPPRRLRPCRRRGRRRPGRRPR